MYKLFYSTISISLLFSNRLATSGILWLHPVKKVSANGHSFIDNSFIGNSVIDNSFFSAVSNWPQFFFCGQLLATVFFLRSVTGNSFFSAVNTWTRVFTVVKDFEQFYVFSNCAAMFFCDG